MHITFKTKSEEFSLSFGDLFNFQINVIMHILNETGDINTLYDKGFSEKKIRSDIISYFNDFSQVKLKTMSVSYSCLVSNILIDYDKNGSRLFSYFLNSNCSELCFIKEKFSNIFCDNLILFFENYKNLYKKNIPISELLLEVSAKNKTNNSGIGDDILLSFISFLKRSRGNKIIVFTDFSLEESISLSSLKKLNNWENILLKAAREVDYYEDIGEWIKENIDDKDFLFNTFWDLNYRRSKEFTFNGDEFFNGGINLIYYLNHY